MAHRPSTDYRSTLNLPDRRSRCAATCPSASRAGSRRGTSKASTAGCATRAAARRCSLLHDGPPYANGSLHVGHAANKILKDMIVRRASSPASTPSTCRAGTATACRSRTRSKAHGRT